MTRCRCVADIQRIIRQEKADAVSLQSRARHAAGQGRKFWMSEARKSEHKARWFELLVDHLKFLRRKRARRTR